MFDCFRLPECFRAAFCMAVGLVVTSACGTVDENPGFTVTDSAGIRVVGLHWEAAPIRWEVHEEPEWTIGDEVDNDLLLFRVRDVQQTVAGSIGIADGGSQQILWVDPSEGHHSRFGREGDGPSEFRGLSSLFPTDGGEVWAFDAARSRLVLVNQDTGVVEERSVATASAQRATRVLAKSLDGGMYLANVAGLPSWTEGWSRSEHAVVSLGPSQDTLLFIPGSEVVMITEPMISTGIVHGGATAVVTGGKDGLWVADTRDPQVALWKSSDGPGSIIRWSSNMDAMRRDRRTSTDAYIRRMDHLMITWAYAEVPASEPLPSLHSLATGPGGELWIGRHDPLDAVFLSDEEPSFEWLIIDAELETADRIRTPAGFRLTQVLDRYILGVFTDELGVETARKYRFDPMAN